MINPDFETFQKLSRQGNLIPVYREILADLETPVAALTRFSDDPYLFLLESVEGGEKWGRYSFLGTDPEIIFKVRQEEVLIRKKGAIQRIKHQGDPLKCLKELLSVYQPVEAKDLPRFYGGAVGFFGYEMVHFFENLPPLNQEGVFPEEAVFMITDTLIIFDHLRQTIKVVACAFTEGRADLTAVYQEQSIKIEALIHRLHSPLKESKPLKPGYSSALQSQMSPRHFKDLVRQAKDYIAAGDIIQVVLSQRFQGEDGLPPSALYRALRHVNPSPYLFFLKMKDLILIGSSPEVMVRKEGEIVELKPIAGTRRRGKNADEDQLLSQELLQDPKERAEHIMLVDLGRNDLGKIANTGTVRVTSLMAVEQYSHVMHLVSNIQANLAQGKDCFDVFRATFPAGTLTGAPKIRAMEIIQELESFPRGPYGGAVGYFSFSGNMDFCITIRTIIIQAGKVYIQAGAGIVYDSDPKAEHQETFNKAQGMMEAFRLASQGLEL